MPELPEVETVRKDLGRHLAGKVITKMKVRRPDLREPITRGIAGKVSGNKVVDVGRRAKYILVGFKNGTMVIHLGMSGTVRADPPGARPAKHDHVEWRTDSRVLRYNDPRRFGRVFWCEDPLAHPLISSAGVEPLEKGFNAKMLHEACAGRKAPVKQLLMDGSMVAGVGNIYASEALFGAGVLPGRKAGTVTRQEAAAIVREVKKVLRRAIKAGGSTLRDYATPDGKPGYFQLSHKVYDRAGQPCKSCSAEIVRTVIGQRATYHCPKCQK